jgi:hypothetical protein
VNPRLRLGAAREMAPGRSGTLTSPGGAVAVETPVVRSMRAAWAAASDGQGAPRAVVQAALALQPTFEVIAAELSDAAPQATATHALPGSCVATDDGSLADGASRWRPSVPTVGVVLLRFDDGSFLVGSEPGVPHFIDVATMTELRAVTCLHRWRLAPGLRITHAEHGDSESVWVALPGVPRQVVRQLAQA